MKRFLKLSNVVLNTYQINRINIEKQKYNIILNNISSRSFIMGSGSIDSEERTIEVCQEKNSDDYNVVDTWIKSL
jgi:hypothetical protein